MGGKTMVVSLPSPWIKKYGIKKGDEIEVEEQNKRIIISTEKAISVSKKRLDISDLTPLINRSIIESYKRGYDEIEIRFDTEELFKRIQKVIEELIGFEIVKQEANYCIVKAVSLPSVAEFDNIVRRLFLVIKRMGEECLNGVKNKDKKILLEVVTLDHNVNKFANLCIRHINKLGYKHLEKNNAMFLILNSLEFIGDEYKKIAKLALNSKLNVNKDVINLYHNVNTLFNLYYEFFYKMRKQKAIEIANLRDKIIVNSSKLLKTKSIVEYELIFVLLTINNLIIRMSGPLLVFIEDD